MPARSPLRRAAGALVHRATILAFVGTKILLVDVYAIPIAVSLGVIGAVLAGAIVASWLRVRLLAAERAADHRAADHRAA